MLRRLIGRLGCWGTFGLIGAILFFGGFIVHNLTWGTAGFGMLLVAGWGMKNS